MEEKWTAEIKAKKSIFDIDIKELFQYKDLIFLLVKKNFTVQYKQTILGPLWYVINPLITTFMYTLIFGAIAGLSTDGTPKFIFYLISNSIWSYFATCLTSTSNTFVANAGIFGKVYFPRLTIPISTVIFSLINFGIVFIMSILAIIFYIWQGVSIAVNITIILIPVYILQCAILGLGCGIIISSLTTKYKDLSILVPVGVQLWMYATPVVYTISEIPEQYRNILLINPLTPIVNNFRYALLGGGEFMIYSWIYSLFMTIIVLVLGVLLFSKIERNFMDTV